MYIAQCLPVIELRKTCVVDVRICICQKVSLYVVGLIVLLGKVLDSYQYGSHLSLSVIGLVLTSLWRKVKYVPR